MRSLRPGRASAALGMRVFSDGVKNDMGAILGPAGTHGKG
jgi:hypothetical protein